MRRVGATVGVAVESGGIEVHARRVRSGGKGDDMPRTIERKTLVYVNERSIFSSTQTFTRDRRQICSEPFTLPAARTGDAQIASMRVNETRTACRFFVDDRERKRERSVNEA